MPVADLNMDKFGKEFFNFAENSEAVTAVFHANASPLGWLFIMAIFFGILTAVVWFSWTWLTKILKMA